MLACAALVCSPMAVIAQTSPAGTTTTSSAERDDDDDDQDYGWIGLLGLLGLAGLMRKKPDVHRHDTTTDVRR